MGVFYFAAADLEQQINHLGLKTVMVASIILVVFTIISALLKNRYKKLKLPFFLVMASCLVVSTVVLFGGTIYLNTKAESKGPVHWHSDIEFWACNSEIELRDPQGALTNKIGSATFHEHNDKRLHLEGVVVHRKEDASLTKFMGLTGGYVTDKSIGIPLNENESEWLVSGSALDGDKQNDEGLGKLHSAIKQSLKGPVLELHNGASCSGANAELQVFVYRFDKASKTYTQTKLTKPTDYVMRDESQVPPGDCVIVEFDTPKARTNKLCRQYGVRDNRRCTEFGVTNFSQDLCNIHEVTAGGIE